ncbi:MAG: hypothetical protein KGQ59_05570 [Bdellovibrionales bacterium]|nr:hypothetical protein [Bdellovibrionales bacterium]
MKKLWALVPALFLTSCATTFVEKDDQWNPEEPVPGLVVHYSFVDLYSLKRGQSWQEALRGVITAAAGQSSALQKSGEKSFARIKPIFNHHNLSLYFDKTAARKAAEIQGVVKSSRTNNMENSGGFLSDGDWLHPDTVEEPFHMQGTFLQGKYYKQIALKTLGGNKKAVAVSMGMTVDVKDSWLFGWKCQADFRARALNQDGKPVLLVSSSGKSSTFWFGGKERYLIEACPEAAEDALKRLSEVETGSL